VHDFSQQASTAGSYFLYTAFSRRIKEKKRVLGKNGCINGKNQHPEK